MGLFFRPRRPLARMAAGAATAGVAYHYGQQRAGHAQPAYEATPPAPYAPPAAMQAAPVTTTDLAPRSQPSGATADLDHLVALHAAGELTDGEFSAAKATLLGL